MKKIFLLSLFFMLIFSISIFAAVEYEITIGQSVVPNGPKFDLQITVYIQSTGTTTFKLGTSNFTMNITAANYKWIGGNPSKLTDGLWDNDNDATNYNDQSLSFVEIDGWISVDINYIGTPTAGVTVPTSTTLVGTISIEITDVGANSGVAWDATGAISILDESGTNITANGTFTPPGDFPLPVELTSFSANVKETEVVLNWRTETEVNNYGFEIERKNPPLNPLQGGDFEKIGFVEGNGNSNSPKEYNFTDSEVNSAGTYSYRLKQIDNDGSYEFSKTIEVNFGSPIKFELNQNYPNPFNPSTTISFSLPESGKIILKIYNVIGKEIKTLVDGYREAGIYTVNFNAEGLPSGMYIYQMSTPENTQVRKMILMK